jgi:cysteinyl-tRNA synthetase
VEGEKMSKSKGNFFTLRDLLAAGHAPKAIRYLLFSVNYRRQLNFTTDGLHQAGASLRRLEDFQRRMRERAAAGTPDPEFAATVESVRQKFIEAMDDDLNTSAALAVIFDFVRAAYQREDQGSLTAAEAQAALDLLADLDRILAILPADAELPDSEIMKLIEDRQAARSRRDFAEADRIRNDLQSRGIQLEDTKEGVRWKRTR